MKHLKVNLLSDKRTSVRKVDAGHPPAKFFATPILLIAIFTVSFGLGRFSLAEEGGMSLTGLGGIPILSQMRHLIISPDRQIRGEDDDRINILLLGMGGEGHDGPYLTDTIMIASIRPSTNDIALLSIPRDLLVPVPNYGWKKINAVNAFGELNTTARGGDLARTTMEGLLGLDIPYYVRIDFDGFRSMVDSVDGIDVYVERSFSDYSYPTEDHGIQIVSFEEGWQTMDGEEALRFARSRHGTSGEGSDFARSKRQQKVLGALKDKLIKKKMFRSPSVIANALASLQANVATNFQIGEILRLAKMARDAESINISHQVVDNGPNSPLVDRIVNGAYVLVPKGDDWNLLRDVASNVLETGEDLGATSPPPPPEKVVAVAVEIQNGTGVSGQARQAAGEVAQLGYNIIKIGNADSFSYDRTLIFDLTDGDLEDALVEIKKALGGAIVKKASSASSHEFSDKADFLIILGMDSVSE